MRESFSLKHFLFAALLFTQSSTRKLPLRWSSSSSSFLRPNDLDLESYLHPQIPAFMMHQLFEAMDVIQERAHELKILGLEEHVDELKIIHVAGTKGKGSTCTFCEAILRESDFQTGLL